MRAEVAVPVLPAPEQLESALWAGPDAATFAVLDGAAYPDLVERLNAAGLERQCLLRTRSPVLERAAPWVVALERGHELTRWLLGEGFGRSGGIFLRSRRPLLDLARHLRRLLDVVTEDGAPYFLRFYDPRILDAFLPTCTATELDQVFGPVLCFLIEDRRAGGLVVHGRDGPAHVRRAAAAVVDAPPRPLADEDRALVAALAERHPSRAQACSVWIAAGGRADDVPEGDARARWTRLWSAAGAGGTTRVALLRAALHEAGALPVLLDAVERQPRPAALDVAARALVERWRGLADAAQLEAVRGATLDAPAAEDDPWFVALVAGLRGRLSAGRRAALLAPLALLAVREDARGDLEDLLATAGDAARGAPSDAACERLLALERRLATAPGVATDVAAPLAQLVAQRRERLVARGAADGRAVRASVLSLQVSLRLGQLRGDARALATVARQAWCALRVTPAGT